MTELPENVKAFIEEAAQTVANIHADRFLLDIESHLFDDEPRPQSPIEQILSAAMRAVIESLENFEDTIDGDGSLIEGGIRIDCQHKAGPYYVDFLISYVFRLELKSFVVECDGHKFHDKDEKQRRYEKRRDRYLQRQGYKIFHYTGAEIVNNPYIAACEIVAEARYSSAEWIVEQIIDRVPAKYREGLRKLAEDQPAKATRSL